MSKGHVYILTNAHMPGLVKIGRTSGCPHERARQLYQTGVPVPFVVRYSVLSPDCAELELLVHERLAENRLNDAREFFVIDDRKAVSVVDELHQEQVEEFVQEFLPAHTVAETDCVVDGGKMHELADAFATHLGEISCALSEITPQELMPAIHRRRKVFHEYQSLKAKGAENE